MKTNKRTLAILTAGLLALTPMAATGMTAFAAGYDITVNNSTADYAYKAYKIFAGNLNGTTLSNIVWASGFDGDALITALKADSILGGDFASVTDAESVAKKLVDLNGNNEKLAQFAKLAYANKGSTSSVTSGELSDGKYTIPVTEAGYYLVEESSAPTGAIISRYMLKVAGPTDVTPKKPTPTLDKVITSPDPKDSGKANNVSIGDAVGYTITSAVPDMTGYSKYFFVINDDLAAGLTFNNDVGITLTDKDTNAVTNLVAGTDYVVQTDSSQTDNHTFQIVFKDFYNKRKGDAGDTITVTYSATLNENADRTTAGNLNTANLTYSNNPNVVPDGESPSNPDEPKPPTPGEPGDPVGTTPDKQTKTYTANIKLTKIKGSDGSVLTGAKFQISGTSNTVVLINGEAFEESATGTYYKLKDGTYALVSSNPAAADIDDSSKKYNKVTNVSSTTDKTNICKEAYVKDDGTLEFGGLGAGTYTITEIVTPGGFNSIAPIEVKINGDGNEFTNGPAWTATKDNAAITMTDTATVAFNVVNNEGATLPSTGGIGTKLFYIIGGLLVAGSVVLLVTKKRMGTREN